MKKLLVLATLLFSCAAVAQAQIATEPGDMRQFKTPQLANEPPFAVSAEPSPFEEELNYYYNKRTLGATEFLWGTLFSLGGLVTTSTLVTLEGLDKVDPSVNRYFVISSYTVTTAAVAVAVWGLFEWINATNAYSDTVRLASQYYNMVQ